MNFFFFFWQWNDFLKRNIPASIQGLSTLNNSYIKPVKTAIIQLFSTWIRVCTYYLWSFSNNFNWHCHIYYSVGGCEKHIFNFQFIWSLIFIFVYLYHSSEISGLCLMKWPCKMLQKLPYFIYAKTQSGFFSFSFCDTLFFP